MNRRPAYSATALAAAIAALLFLGACGRKGDPYPRKELHKPEAPKESPKGDQHG